MASWSKLNSWWPGHRDEVIQTILLGIALFGTGKWAAPIPLRASLPLLVLAILMPNRSSTADGSVRRWFAARLSTVIAIAAGGAVLLYFTALISSRALLFIPVWIALSLLWSGAAWALNRGYLHASCRSWERWAASRYDILLGEGVILDLILRLAGKFYPNFWIQRWAPELLVIAFLAFQRILGWHRFAASGTAEGRRCVIKSLCFAVTVVLFSQIGFFPLDSAHSTVFFWSVFWVSIYRGALRLAPSSREGFSENLRWLLLGLAALFLLRGFARYTLHGTNDALWYGTMLADMVTQVRHGIFPVWIGQSEFQFNGSIYPLRVAPAFHHLGALLDLLTFHTLGIFALQNLLIVLIGCSAIFSAYVSFRSLLPGQGWAAAALAVLFLACPGVLGISYNTDLYMSWTTVPWIPLALGATVKTFYDRDTARAMIVLGLALGLSWWGHSPIALWLTLVVGVAQVCRFSLSFPTSRAWINAGKGALIFILVAAYPVGSVLLFPPEASAKSASFQEASAATVTHFLRQVFPSVLRPLSEDGRQLGDFQLGWTLWIFLVFGLVQWRRSAVSSRVLFLLAAGIALLLTPIPGLNLWLWKTIPNFVRNTTGNWVMNRMYLILSGVILTGFAASAARWLQGGARRKILILLLTLGSAWSFAEATNYSHGSDRSIRPPETAVDLLRPENIQITRFAYLIFPALPSRFTHGTADPRLENRLLALGSFQLINDDLAAARASAKIVASGKFVPPPGPSVFVELNHRFTLEAGQHYLFEFKFDRPQATAGVLQLTGPPLFREYGLPEYGGTQAFGIGGSHSQILSVWNSSNQKEEISVRFFPNAQPVVTDQVLPLAEVEQLTYDPDSLPIKVEGWMPYRARVSSPTEAWLETPRMFQRYFRAKANGISVPIEKSPDGLAAIRVSKGNSTVELYYSAPWTLQLIYWISLSTIMGLLTWGALQVIRSRPQPQS